MHHYICYSLAVYTAVYTAVYATLYTAVYATLYTAVYARLYTSVYPTIYTAASISAHKYGAWSASFFISVPLAIVQKNLPYPSSDRDLSGCCYHRQADVRQTPCHPFQKL